LAKVTAGSMKQTLEILQRSGLNEEQIELLMELLQHLAEADDVFKLLAHLADARAVARDILGGHPSDDQLDAMVTRLERIAELIRASA
jgi:hypothetical protein